MNDSPRALWIVVRYNWTTREKRHALYDSAEMVALTKLSEGPFAEGEHIYWLGFHLDAPREDGSTSMTFEHVREEDPTRRKLGEGGEQFEGETLEAYVCRAAALRLDALLPADAYPISFASTPGKPHFDFTTRESSYRLKVDRRDKP